MKRKGRKHEIPDFSSKRKPSPARDQLVQPRGSVAPPPPRAPAIKPHATSAKSGRRGS